MEDCESLNLDPVWYLCYNNYDKLQASCLDHKLHISISCLDEVSWRHFGHAASKAENLEKFFHRKLDNKRKQVGGPDWGEVPSLFWGMTILEYMIFGGD